jgi:hypothetical protein
VSGKRSILSFGAPELPRFSCLPSRYERDFRRRGSAQARGYDAAWDRLSQRHRRREPLCRECLFRGRRQVWELTNHTIPVRDRPDLRLDRDNLSSLCQRCHDTTIRMLEELARAAGDIELMDAWLADPSTRPQGHAYRAKAFPAILRRPG